jgi:hypothetical protein
MFLDTSGLPCYHSKDEPEHKEAQRLFKSEHVASMAGFYRAMSLFQQGKKEEARKLAAGAVRKMKPLPKDEKNPLAGDANPDDLILWLAYKEAKAMIQFDAAPLATNQSKQ